MNMLRTTNPALSAFAGWVATGLILASAPGHAGQTPLSSQQGPFAARDAGARYGQALGAVEICHGSKLTDKAKALVTGFQGSDKDAFTAAAAKVFEAWAKVKACANQDDPNQCKIIMDKSCLAAEAEIGARGTVINGLVDFLPR